MPIYEFECEHGIKEIYFAIPSDEETYKFQDCKCIANRIISLSIPKPDSLWSGVQTNHGYVTSQSQLNNIKKEKGITDISTGDYAGWKKEVQRNKEARKEKSREEIKKAVVDACYGDE